MFSVVGYRYNSSFNMYIVTMMYRYLHGHTDGLNSGEENIKINT